MMMKKIFHQGFVQFCVVRWVLCFLLASWKGERERERKRGLGVFDFFSLFPYFFFEGLCYRVVLCLVPVS